MQYDTFCTIAQLRLTGLSFREIKKYLENRSHRKMIELFTDQTAIINKKIKELHQIKKNLNNIRKNAKNALMAEAPVFIVREPVTILVLVKPYGRSR